MPPRLIGHHLEDLLVPLLSSEIGRSRRVGLQLLKPVRNICLIHWYRREFRTRGRLGQLTKAEQLRCSASDAPYGSRVGLFGLNSKEETRKAAPEIMLATNSMVHSNRLSGATKTRPP